MICGIMPKIGGRIVVYRKIDGANALDARPELWKQVPSPDLLSTHFTQYYGESVWAGPQSDWWTAKEPYPPVGIKSPSWPPDPAWETAPFTVLEQSPTRVVLRSPISKLTGLELTKTVELLKSGQLNLHYQVVNRGDREVKRDLWFLHRVQPTARCFLHLKSETEDKGFAQAASVTNVAGLTVLELLPHGPSAKLAAGKMSAVPTEGWMATTVSEGFFVVRFQAIDASKAAPGQAPVEVYYSTAPNALCEMEHHGELKTLEPGQRMESKESWQFVPYTGKPSAEAQAQFLNKEESTRAGTDTR
jgi:hypothetical protein